MRRVVSLVDFDDPEVVAITYLFFNDNSSSHLQQPVWQTRVSHPNPNPTPFSNPNPIGVNVIGYTNDD